jgi:hypothetical protein
MIVITLWIRYYRSCELISWDQLGNSFHATTRFMYLKEMLYMILIYGNVDHLRMWYFSNYKKKIIMNK